MANETNNNSKCVICESKVHPNQDWIFERFSLCCTCRDRILGTIE